MHLHMMPYSKETYYNGQDRKIGKGENHAKKKVAIRFGLGLG